MLVPILFALVGFVAIIWAVIMVLKSTTSPSPSPSPSPSASVTPTATATPTVTVSPSPQITLDVVLDDFKTDSVAYLEGQESQIPSYVWQLANTPTLDVMNIGGTNYVGSSKAEDRSSQILLANYTSGTSNLTATVNATFLSAQTNTAVLEFGFVDSLTGTGRGFFVSWNTATSLVFSIFEVTGWFVNPGYTGATVSDTPNPDVSTPIHATFNADGSLTMSYTGTSGTTYSYSTTQTLAVVDAFYLVIRHGGGPFPSISNTPIISSVSVTTTA